jgi:type IV pilus assembly protein PilA
MYLRGHSENQFIEQGVAHMEIREHLESRQNCGFTLIELMLVIAIIGILASLAVSAYQTYTVRSQVSAGIAFASAAKVSIVNAYSQDLAPPTSRPDAGMTIEPSDSSSSYVSGIDIINGRIEVTFGNDAHQDIVADTLSLTPYITADNTVVWRCGNAPAPAGSLLSGGGVSTEHAPATVDPRYLPSSCR